MKHEILSEQRLLEDYLLDNSFDLVLLTSNCRRAHGEPLISDLFRLLPSFKDAVLDYEGRDPVESEFVLPSVPQVGNYIIVFCPEINKHIALLYMFDYYHPNVVPCTQSLYHCLSVVVNKFKNILMFRPAHTQNCFY